MERCCLSVLPEVVTEEATHEYEEQKQKAAEEKQKRMEASLTATPPDHRTA